MSKQHRWNPEKYANNSSEQLKWAIEALSELNIDENTDLDIIDVGCGDGKITAQIARDLTRGQVVGVDLSEEMIRFAAENSPVKNILILASGLVMPKISRMKCCLMSWCHLRRSIGLRIMRAC